MRVCLVLFVALVIVSCKPGGRGTSSDSERIEEEVVQDGVVKKFDVQHRLVSEVTYKDGMRHGITRYYYSSGALSDEIMYINDLKNGIAKKFHKNGKIYSLTPYFQGKKEGVQKKFYSNGKLWAETPYRKGLPGKGLKEYKRTGELRNNYPRIEVQKFLRGRKVILHVFLSNHSKNVVFYETELAGGQFIPQRVQPIFAESGIARIEIPLDNGKSIETSVSIVAKYRTMDHNIYVTQRTYPVKVNR
ncbi:MAG: toxin-antitoxin system YwqK family antitoxin [Marinifilaceae bacterium]